LETSAVTNMANCSPFFLMCPLVGLPKPLPHANRGNPQEPYSVTRSSSGQSWERSPANTGMIGQRVIIWLSAAIFTTMTGFSLIFCTLELQWPTHLEIRLQRL